LSIEEKETVWHFMNIALEQKKTKQLLQALNWTASNDSHMCEEIKKKLAEYTDNTYRILPTELKKKFGNKSMSSNDDEPLENTEHNDLRIKFIKELQKMGLLVVIERGAYERY